MHIDAYNVNPPLMLIIYMLGYAYNVRLDIIDMANIVLMYVLVAMLLIINSVYYPIIIIQIIIIIPIIVIIIVQQV